MQQAPVGQPGERVVKCQAVNLIRRKLLRRHVTPHTPVAPKDAGGREHRRAANRGPVHAPFAVGPTDFKITELLVGAQQVAVAVPIGRSHIDGRQLPVGFANAVQRI